jgi:hypothetical protein
MTTATKAEPSRKLRLQSIVPLLIVVVVVVISAWALATVSTSSRIPSADFVTMPTTPLSKSGVKTMFVSVSPIMQKGVAVGVQGSLQDVSGGPISGATVYMEYYLQGAYRTQAALTDQNGHFEARFPMNWTGWLPLTLTYLGDNQHQGLTQVFSVAGEPQAAQKVF